MIDTRFPNVSSKEYCYGDVLLSGKRGGGREKRNKFVKISCKQTCIMDKR